MTVPDPEDPKYWYQLIRTDLSGKQRHGAVSMMFDYKKYIKDFQRWKDELRRRFSLCNGCAWKEKCLEVRLNGEGICPDLLAPHEVLKEILGEEASE